MKMRNRWKKAISLLCVLALLVTNFVFTNGTNAKASDSDLTAISWSDFGIEVGTYNTDWQSFTYQDTTATTLNNTRFTGKIQFSEKSGIRYGGSDGSFGLHLSVQDGKLILRSDTFTLGNFEMTSQEASYYGITEGTFADAEFELTIVMTDVTASSATVGVWVNQIAVDEEFTLTENGLWGASLGNKICMFDGNDVFNGGTVTIPEDKPDVPTGPVAPPTDLKEIGWSDFGIEAGTYNTDWQTFTYQDTTATTLNNTRFTGKIQFSKNSGIRYGGADGSFGLHLSVQEGKLILRSDTFTFEDFEMTSQDASDYGITSGSFADAEIELTIVMTDVTTTSATVGVWVNGVAVDGEFTMTENGQWNASLGNKICMFDGNDVFNGGTVTVPEDKPDVEPDVPADPVAPPTDLKAIGWEDFGITSDTTYKDYAYVTYAGGDSLDGTLFVGDILMGNTDSSQKSEIRYAASAGGCWGLNICVENGLLYLTTDTMDIVSGGEALVSSNKYYSAPDFGAGDSFSNATFNLKISTEIEGNNYTFGIWINDIMVGNYFTLARILYGGGTTLSGGNQIGLDIGAPGFVTVYPDVQEVTYTDITWSDFGIAAGTYNTAWQSFAYQDATAKTLNNTRFTGKIQFSENAGIRYGGSNESFGLHVSVQNGKLFLRSDTFNLENFEMTSQDASDYGISTGTFADAEFELTITMTDVTSTNATVGVWINGIAVDEKFTMTENGLWGASLGNRICMFDGNDVFAGGTVTIPESGEEETGPVEIITPPTDFTTITLADFGGTVESAKLASGSYISGQLKKKSYDRTLFDADIDLTTKTPGNDTYIRFGGESDGWVGISVQSTGNGTMRLIDTRTGTTVATYVAKTAGVNFYEGQFNLKVSFEYVDSDDDGAKDDVKVGVYFNNVLYNSQYSYFKDFAMTTWLLAYTDDGALHPFRLRLPGETDPEPIAPPTHLKVITFSSFGIEDADFTEIDTGHFCASGFYYDLVKGATLDGTLFHGKVKFSTLYGCDIRYGGLETPWKGLLLGTNNTTSLLMLDAERDIPAKDIVLPFTPEEAGTTLTGEWLDLKMSTEFVDSDGDGKKDDVKFGIWFNDIMYKNTYYYFVDYAPYMGSYLSVYSANEDSHISIRSVEVDDSIDLSFYGFGNDYRSQFSAETAFVAEGEPLGVTDEYETVDYDLDTAVTKVGASETDTSQDIGEKQVPIVIWIAAGVVILLMVFFLIVLLAKKRKKKNESPIYEKGEMKK